MYTVCTHFIIHACTVPNSVNKYYPNGAEDMSLR